MELCHVRTHCRRFRFLLGKRRRMLGMSWEALNELFGHVDKYSSTAKPATATTSKYSARPQKWSRDTEVVCQES